MELTLGRWALQLWPRDFRQRLGQQMLQAYADGCRAARLRRGAWGGAAHTVRALLELCRQGLAQRLLGTPRPSRPTPRLPGDGSVLNRYLTDFRYAARALRNAPTFSALAVATLALGIGANTAIFSVVNGVLLAPLPYAAPDELVVFTMQLRGRGGIQTSEPELYDLKQRTRSFADIAAMDFERLTLGGAAEPERIAAAQFTWNMMPMLGVEPLLGRGFTARDDSTAGDRVVILSHTLWQQAFAGDAGMLGREIELEGVPHTVIGVMPGEFAYPDAATRAWIPLRLDPDNLWERNNHYLYSLGRLAADASIESARAELSLLAEQLGAEFPEFYADGDVAFEVTGMLESEVGDSTRALWILLGAVAFVLLVACTNVAHLMLARGETRRHEVAVRAALGSGRGAIVRQHLVESLMLALLGAVAGLAIAYWGVRFLLALSPDALPRAANVGISAEVLLFTLLVSALTSLVFGLVPALQVARTDPQEGLRDGSRTYAGGAGGRRSRSLLVVGEVALAAILLVACGVMLRSFANLRSIDPGFDYTNVVTMQVSLPAFEYEEPPEVVSFHEQVLARLARLPGVEAVGAAARLPLARGANRWSLQIEGRMVETTADAPVGQIQQVTSGYFEAMGLRLLRGRVFDAADRADAAGVAIVSESFAALHWPGEDALGKRVKVFLEDWPWMEVVGIVANVQHESLESEPFPKIYFPHAQSWQTAYVSPASMHVVARHTGDPAALLAAMRAEVWRVNGNAPISMVSTMEEVMAGSLAAERFLAVLLTVFAAVALFLAAVGIAGVMAYTVSERTREIGIRMALGARRNDVVRLVVSPALALTAAGLAIGIAGSITVARWIQGLLYGIAAVDPLTYTIVALLFTACSLCAAWLPARRASGVNPVSTLRGA